MKKKSTINRRKFIKLTAAGTATTGVAALMVYSDKLFKALHHSSQIPIDVKKTFARCGACSHTFYCILNREFGYPDETGEQAADPLAGGLMMTQNQCGMLWGSTLAAGAEAFRRFNDPDQAAPAALIAAQHLVQSLTDRAKSVNCRDIIGCDTASSFDIMKFMVKSLPGGFTNMVCMNLAEKWAPEAIQSAKEGLSSKQPAISRTQACCACEVARKMGASDEEMVAVAGFSGGIGLSGNACGALGAAIWLSTLAWCRKNPGESGYSNPNSEEILNTFYSLTGNEILCSKISGQHFETIDDHTEYIENGGCSKLVYELAANFQIEPHE